MPNVIVQQTIDQIKATEGVEESATLFINTMQAKIDAAVAQALENGATAEELQPVSDVSNEMQAKTAELAAAIAANGG